MLEMLGKAPRDSKAVCITTALYTMKNGAYYAWNVFTEKSPEALLYQGWGQISLLELSAIPSIDSDVR